MNRDFARRRPATTWFVSRHPGAIEWAQQHELAIGRWAAHLDPAEVAAGDTVIGALPIHLAAAVCARGARYLHLCVAAPEAWRGSEFSAQDLRSLAARIEEYRVDCLAADRHLERT